MTTVPSYVSLLIPASSSCRPRTPMDPPFINRLPPELLVTITTFITNQDTIFRLTTVCRYWHDALTGAATLWTSIDCRSESRTSILLQRSKSNPIDITIDHFVPGGVSLIANHIHRMRSIEMSLPPHHLGEVRSLFNGSAPILETMRMQGRGEDSSAPTEAFPPYSSFFQGQFPALRTLHFAGYPFDLTQSTPVITSGLTTLTLDNQRHHRLHHLLEWLEHCDNLVHLRVDLPNLQETVPASRMVTLPNLRELWLVHWPLAALRHLSFPPSTTLSIRSRAERRVGRYPVTALWAEERLPGILESRIVEGIEMVFDKSSCVVAFVGPRLLLLEEVKADLSHEDSIFSDILDSFQLLPISATTILRFLQPPQYPFTGTFRRQSCIRLLRQMSALEQITLDNSVAWNFIRALESTDGGVLCPNLRALTVIRRAGYEVGIWGSLLDLSNLRKDRGCPLVCDMVSPCFT